MTSGPRPTPPSRTAGSRPLRDREHARTATGTNPQHARGQRILRDGTREESRARTRPKTRTRPNPTAPTPRPAASRRRPSRRRALRLPLASPARRLHVVLIVLAMGLSLCAGRLLQLQGFDSSSYAADALTRTLPLLPSRGQITDRNGLVLAENQPAVAVTADPTLTGPKAEQLAPILSGYLQMPQSQLIPLLTRQGTHFVYLKKKVPALTYSALAADLAGRGIYGIFRESDPVRTYPNGSVGGSVIGFVGADGKGQAGLELTLDSTLAGTEGRETYESAPNGGKIPLGQSSMTPAKNGLNYQLTLDSELQWVAERRIAAQVQKTKADSGFAIVVNVKTGELLALANAPTVNPADPGATAQKDRGNRAVSDPYEPGSVEKVLTSAALLDSGTATPSTKVVVPHLLASGDAHIKDHWNHGTIHLRMRGVVARSSNIGTALLTRQLSKQKLHDYLVSFGLGSTTGIGLPGESAGIIPRADMSDGQRDQVAFGQAISVTGVQQAAAIAGIINHGVYNPPTVIKSATGADGQAVPVDGREPRRIISEKSSAEVRELMQAVTDWQQNLQLDSYDTGGKTGTAQRADTKCHCYKGYVTSYVNFAPVNDPQIMTYVVLSNPKSGDTGAGTAGPVARDIMNYALPRYSIAPDAKPHKPLPLTW